uniref:Dolichyl-diphosphooligosaccharide-protein glycosyltransferase subunit TMEM258 n=1 Tax=Astatotilapia calliptera TaxID=8154 RepID=A0AAX7SX52_ASTCA
MELEAMTRYTSPVNPAVFPHLTVVLLAIGMFFTAWFFVYEVTSTKYTRDVYKELLISLVASLFMGFGVLFLLLWVGIYVTDFKKKKKEMKDTFQCNKGHHTQHELDFGLIGLH